MLQIIHHNNIILHYILYHLKAIVGPITIHKEKLWLALYILFCRDIKGLQPLNCQVVGHIAFSRVCKFRILIIDFHKPAAV